MALTRAVILATISLTISLPLRTNRFRAFFAQGAEASEFPSPGWRPNQGPLRLADYVGRKVCAQCHPSEATTQPATPMAHAAEAVSECAILRQHPHFNFRLGPFDTTSIAGKIGAFIRSATGNARSPHRSSDIRPGKGRPDLRAEVGGVVLSKLRQFLQRHTNPGHYARLPQDHAADTGRGTRSSAFGR